MTHDELIVYDILSKNIKKSISEIMAAPGIGFGKSKATELLKTMSGKGIVLIEGTGRATKYRIKS